MQFIIDYEKAFYYFKKGCDLKDIKSQHMLGYLYFRGLGCTQNYKESFKYFKLAANQGLQESQKFLYKHYKNGYGCERDEEEAEFWYNCSKGASPLINPQIA